MKQEELIRILVKALDTGASEIHIKVSKDGYFVSETHRKENPTRSEIEDSIGNAVLYEFGGIEMHQGQCRVLDRIKKTKI